MKLSFIFLSISFFLGLPLFSEAQEVLPNQISSKKITELKLTGISYQESKRAGYPKNIYKSTAFFINKNCLLTSAHNLTSIKGHDVIKITLYPARNGREKPFKPIVFNVKHKNYYRIIDRSFFTFRWRKRPHDMALIYIPDSIINETESLKKIAYLPLLPSSEEIHKGDTIYCAGYPATDKYANKNVMTLTKSTIRGIYRSHFSHRLETYPGNSGSPIMVKRDNKFYVIAVHSIQKNGTWLNKKRQILVQKWITELKE